MKKLPLLIALSLAAPVIAGTTSSKAVIAPAEPSLWSWFAGASVGQLDDLSETMYHVHAGVDTPWKVAGWDVALFGEYGWTETEAVSTTVPVPVLTIAPTALGPLDVYQQLEVKPLTFNVKFERPLTGKLNAYVGAGAGVAFVDYTVKNSFYGVNLHDNDESFVFQAFAGLNYNLCSKMEVYAGARWIAFDYDSPVTAASSSVSLDDDVLYEAGLRYNF